MKQKYTYTEGNKRHLDADENVIVKKDKVLMIASVASMIDQFNMPNIRLMQEMGYEVHVACNFLAGNTCDEARIRFVRKTLRDMHVVQHQWDCPRDVCSISSFVKSCCRAYRQLQQLAARYRFKWMHCQSPVGGALARLAAHQYGIKVIYTAHGFHFYKGAPVRNWLLYYPAEKLLAHWTDILVTLNWEDYRLARMKFAAGKVCHIPGIGIDVRHFRDTHADVQQIRRKYGIPQTAVLLLSVGELSGRKNHQIVISALAGLGRQDVYYMICGQGECKKELLQHAERLGVAAYIRLIGYQEDIAPLYHAADLFVFPSLQEGMPAALMEAMAAGMPCAVSDIRGNRELIDADGGKRFSPLKEMDIYQCLSELLEDQSLWCRYGQYNQNKILNYDTAIVSKKMRGIYKDIENNAVSNARLRYQNRRHRLLNPSGNRVQKQCEAQYTFLASAKQFKYGASSGYKQRMYKQGCRQNLPVVKDDRICTEYVPKISVIMSVYNASGHVSNDRILRAAVSSICSQTYSEWELVICDDGSTDRTWNLLLELAAKDPRIRLVRHAGNCHAGHARNTCIRASHGQYIAVMDADDISSQNRLEMQHKYLEMHPDAAFVGSRGEFFVRRPGDDGELYWYCARPEADDFLFSMPYVHASMMFRREALEQVHGYDGSRHAVRAEDYDLLLRLYAAGLRGVNLPDVHYYIRRDRAQLMRRKYRYRFNEAYVKYRGFKQLGLMPQGLLYAAKPLLVGLIPVRMTAAIQRKYYKTKQ